MLVALAPVCYVLFKQPALFLVTYQPLRNFKSNYLLVFTAQVVNIAGLLEHCSWFIAAIALYMIFIFLTIAELFMSRGVRTLISSFIGFSTAAIILFIVVDVPCQLGVISSSLHLAWSYLYFIPVRFVIGSVLGLSFWYLYYVCIRFYFWPNLWSTAHERADLLVMRLETVSAFFFMAFGSLVVSEYLQDRLPPVGHPDPLWLLLKNFIKGLFSKAMSWFS